MHRGWGTSSRGQDTFIQQRTPPPPTVLTQLPGAPRALPSPFSAPKSKADTLNAVKDIDLNLRGVRVILMGVCVCEQNRGEVTGVCAEGEDDLRAPAGHKARARAAGALSLTKHPEDR